MSGLALVLRWLHILPAVIAGGATVFSAVALLPTLGELPDEARRAARERIAACWRPVVTLCVALLLLSGLANFFLFQAPVHRGQPLYHALFGVKFLAALVVFFLASALVGRSPALQGIRDRAKTWTAVNAILIGLIVVISGALRSIPPSP